jgi:hypothetical protein
VVHELKGSIAALSTLSEASLQRDALHTVAQAMNRMKSILGRLQEGRA